MIGLVKANAMPHRAVLKATLVASAIVGLAALEPLVGAGRAAEPHAHVSVATAAFDLAGLSPRDFGDWDDAAR